MASRDNKHLDETTIKYGEGVLSLRKSDKLIGVKPQPGIGRDVLSAIAPGLDRLDSPTKTLGGFRLINVEDAAAPMEETLDALRANETVNEGTHVYYTSDDEVPFVPTGQIYIECSPEATPEQCQQLIEEHGLHILEARDERVLIARVTERSSNPVKTAESLQKSPLIEKAEPSLASPGKLRAFAVPVDIRLADQWHLRNTGFHRNTSVGFLSGADSRVVAAWNSTESLGSPSVIVAVIDDGFDLSHPDLSGSWKIVAPRDFTRNSTSPTPDYDSEDWHGSACAGVAVGNADGAGIVGAAPRSRLMPIRWGPDLSEEQVEKWFDYAREQGAWVVSCSWSAMARNFPLGTRRYKAIERCAREGRGGLGTIICFAAGNENRDVNSPASNSVNGFANHPDVIAVSASNSMDQKSHYSNFGKEISICAPSSGAGGWGITTSDVMGQYTRNGHTFDAGYAPGAYNDDFGGTSSSCPLAAGICALILSIKPGLKATEVKSLLQRTARKIGPATSYDASGHSVYFGYGCVDALAAVQALSQQAVFDKAWGAKGHGINNKIAISALPSTLRDFYERHEKFIEGHAMDADEAKNTDPDERPRHFIDIDLYGEYPFTDLPEDFDEAVKKFGEEKIIKNGVLPWHIEKTYLELAEAFKAGQLEDILRLSAWLGHYVGDAHVPFHSTSNHDGKLTGQKGIHSYFETGLLKNYISPDRIKPSEGKKITGRPRALAFEWVLESYTYVKPLLDADAANGGKTGNRDMEGFSVIAKPIAINRLTKGCSRLASLWYSAWIQAGMPSLEPIIVRTNEAKEYSKERERESWAMSIEA